MIHPSVKIHPTARIDCTYLFIGEGGQIGKNCVIEGHHIEIGRNFWMDEDAVIGGGSCHDPMAFLKAGDFLHMGRNSQLNIARGITIGDEVGIGIQTQVFTHGAYLNELDGFPVQFAPVTIGSKVWLPNAWVNPGVTIGDNVVVAARSLINIDIPTGSLAGGTPVKILKANHYPKCLPIEKRIAILESILTECKLLLPDIQIEQNVLSIQLDKTIIDCDHYIIEGFATKASDIILNQLRRHGIRFRYTRQKDQYLKWN